MIKKLKRRTKRKYRYWIAEVRYFFKYGIKQRRRNSKRSRTSRFRNIDQWRQTSDARRKAALSDHQRFPKDKRRLITYCRTVLEYWFYSIISIPKRLLRKLRRNPSDPPRRTSSR